MLKFPSLRIGKYCAQASHASLGAFLNCSNRMDTEPLAGQYMNQWLYDSFIKIVLYTESLEEILDLYQKVEENKIPCALITDNGTTEFHGKPTVTALGIGPWLSEDIDKITGNLNLF